MFKNDIDLNNILEDDWKDHDSEFNWKRGVKIFNKTSYFALPLIGMTVEGNTCSRYLQNAYVNDHSIEHDFENCLFLLFKVKNQKEKFWIDFCKAAELKDNYIFNYLVGKNGDYDLLMYVFKVPEKWIPDFQFYKKGQYSKTSEAYKKLFPQYIYTPSGDKRESRIWGILNKSNALKDEVVKKFIVPTTSTADDIINLRRDMDSWEEIWDAPQKNAEIYAYSVVETGTC